MQSIKSTSVYLDTCCLGGTKDVQFELKQSYGDTSVYNKINLSVYVSVMKNISSPNQSGIIFAIVVMIALKLGTKFYSVQARE